MADGKPDLVSYLLQPDTLLVGAGLILVHTSPTLDLDETFVRVVSAIGLFALISGMVWLAVKQLTKDANEMAVVQRGFAAGVIASVVSWVATGWLYYRLNMYPWLDGMSLSEKALRTGLPFIAIGSMLGVVLTWLVEVVGAKRKWRDQRPKDLARRFIVTFILFAYFSAIAGTIVYVGGDLRRFGLTFTDAEQGNVQLWQAWTMLLVYVVALTSTYSILQRRPLSEAFSRSLVTMIVAGLIGAPLVLMVPDAEFTTPTTNWSGEVPTRRHSPGGLVGFLLAWVTIAFLVSSWPRNRFVDTIAVAIAGHRKT